MMQIELPTLRATDCVAVTIEQAELAGSSVWVVSTRNRPGRAVLRRWYPDPAAAMAYAAEQAEQHGLLLFDLRDPGDD